MITEQQTYSLAWATSMRQHSHRRAGRPAAATRPAERPQGTPENGALRSKTKTLGTKRHLIENRCCVSGYPITIATKHKLSRRFCDSFTFSDYSESPQINYCTWGTYVLCSGDCSTYMYICHTHIHTHTRSLHIFLLR